MSPTAGEIQNMRANQERQMTATLSTMRATETDSQYPGDPPIKEWNAYLTDVPCRIIPGGVRETRDGDGRPVLVRRNDCLVIPWGTDVRQDDLVSNVTDQLGESRYSVNLSILGIEKPETHIELVVEAVDEAS